MVNGVYELQIGESYWMEEISLGIGRYRGVFAGIQQELLFWYDKHYHRYLLPEEIAEQEKLRAEQLGEYLRSLGVDPDNLPH